MLQELDEIGRTKKRTGEMVEVHGRLVPEGKKMTNDVRRAE
jgi:hypothetical protein